MNREANFSSMASMTFGRESYQIWAVRMQAYLETFCLWEAVEFANIISLLPYYPTMTQINKHQERKIKKSKEKAC